MNELFASLGLEPLKGILTDLVLPPVPLLLLVVYASGRLYRRRPSGIWLMAFSVFMLWATCTTAFSGALMNLLVPQPRALSPAEIGALQRSPKTAIVVLGGGRRLLSPEYGVSNLSDFSIERLRFGLWLARETSLPVAFSGGVGHAALGGPSEAEIAARIADKEFGRRIQWLEAQSRDTSENGMRTVALLKNAGITRIVLVTHGFHMRRAKDSFQRAAAHHGGTIEIVAAPMGLSPDGRLRLGDFLPTSGGFEETRLAIREWLGRLAGA